MSAGDDDEDPTPPAWFTFRVMSDECRRAADRLDQVALVSRKRLDLLDPRRARRCDDIASKLRHLAAVFDLWEHTELEQVARERDACLPEMTALLRETLGILEALPSVGALGPVRRPR